MPSASSSIRRGGLLNVDYTSTFFDRNVLRADAAPGRALIGNYQHLGLFDGQDLAILSPRKSMRRHDDALGASHESSAAASDPLVKRKLTYYQGASYDFSHHLLDWLICLGCYRLLLYRPSLAPTLSLTTRADTGTATD